MRGTPAQHILRLLRKTHREVQAILAILSKPAEDFSKEDASVRSMTRKVKAARKRIPNPRTTNNKTKDK